MADFDYVLLERSGDFATITTENLVHASDGHDSAEREIALWFPAA